MTIVESTRPVTGGVDTHLDVHVAAVVDANGGVLGVRVVRDDAGRVRRVARLACRVRCGRSGGGGRHRRVWGGTGPLSGGEDLEVIEVDRPNRQLRRRNGKSDKIDAIEAARAALSGRASGIAKSADGDVEAIRVLMVARRSGRDVRIKYLNQIRHLGFTAPDELRERLRDVPADQSGTHRRGVATHRRRRHRHARDETRDPTLGRRVLDLEADAQTSRRRCSTRWSAAPRRACSRSTASGPTPPRSCSSPRATTRTG